MKWFHIAKNDLLSAYRNKKGLLTERKILHFKLEPKQPQGEPIESKGPFIGDTQDDIKRLYKEYREGKMRHISTVPSKQRITW